MARSPSNSKQSYAIRFAECFDPRLTVIYIRCNLYQRPRPLLATVLTSGDSGFINFSNKFIILFFRAGGIYAACKIAKRSFCPIGMPVCHFPLKYLFWMAGYHQKVGKSSNICSSCVNWSRALIHLSVWTNRSAPWIIVEKFTGGQI